MATGETLSIIGAARRAGKTERTIRLWVQEQHIEATYDEKGKRRIVAASLDAYLAASGKVAAPEPSPEVVAAALAGLPEMVAELAKMRQEINTLQWQNGHLTAALDAAKRQVLLLEPGSVAVAAPVESPETIPETLPEMVAEPDTRPWWERLKGWVVSRPEGGRG